MADPPLGGPPPSAVTQYEADKAEQLAVRGAGCAHLGGPGRPVQDKVDALPGRKGRCRARRFPGQAEGGYWRRGRWRPLGRRLSDATNPPDGPPYIHTYIHIYIYYSVPRAASPSGRIGRPQLVAAAGVDTSASDHRGFMTGKCT